MYNRFDREYDSSRRDSRERQGYENEREGRFGESGNQQRFSGRRDIGDEHGDMFQRRDMERDGNESYRGGGAEGERRYSQAGYRGQERYERGYGYDEQERGMGRGERGSVEQGGGYGGPGWQGGQREQPWSAGRGGEGEMGGIGRGRSESWSGRGFGEQGGMGGRGFGEYGMSRMGGGMGGMGRGGYGAHSDIGGTSRSGYGEYSGMSGMDRDNYGEQGGGMDRSGYGQVGGMTDRRRGGYGEQSGGMGRGYSEHSNMGMSRAGQSEQWDRGGYGQMGRSSGMGMGSQGAQGTRSSFAGRGPKGYKRTDERIREDICDRLTQHDEIDAGDIDVNVSNGEVTLQGTVESRHVKHMVENLVDAVQGVQDVHNQIRVKRNTQESRSSDEKGALGQSSAHVSSPQVPYGQPGQQAKTSGQEMQRSEAKTEQKGQETGKNQTSEGSRRNSAS